MKNHNKVYKSKADMLTAEEKTANFYIDFQITGGFHRFICSKTHHSLHKLIDSLSINGRYYFNEIVINGHCRKPYLDLEKVFKTKAEFDSNYDYIITKLQFDIMKVFRTEYGEILTRSDILLLDSSGEVSGGYKISLHVVVSPLDRTLYYTNSKFTESSAYHFYTSLINLDQTYEEILDSKVYCTDQNFRIIGSHKKFDDDRCLRPINPISFEPIENYMSNLNEPGNVKILDYLLTYIDPDKESYSLTTPIIEQTCKNKKLITKNQPTKTDCKKQLLELVQRFHPTAFYNGFYKDVFHSFNYTNRNEKCPISGLTHDSNGFFVYETDNGYYLKCHSKHCKKKKIHIGYADEADEFIDNAIQISQPYLIMQGGIDSKPAEPVKKWISEWLARNDVLAVKSAMGTGKTTMIHKILDYNSSIKTVLWITHRQTLTRQIYGSFKSKKFVNYMDSDKRSLFEYDRVIVQIDSLTRINWYTDDDQPHYKQYDLVIIDEVEGCLNHFSSPFLGKPDFTANDIFDSMVECIEYSKNLLLLDADLGIRSKLFMNYFSNNPIVINNSFKPWTKIYHVSNDQKQFNDKMFADIADGKNICIVSMSSIKLECIKVELDKKKVKYVMHTSLSDDKLKTELEDVNNFWTKFQVVLYSPTIESGVDFNKTHFDKIYCIIKNGQHTCSQRSFLQMVGRIRKVTDPNIQCLYNGPYILDATFYAYEDVLAHVRYFEELNGKRILKNIKYETTVENGIVKKKRIETDISLFDQIIILNEVENLNKHPETSLTILAKSIQRSGHELKIEYNSNAKNKKEINPVKIEEILSEIDIAKYDISALLIKQSKNQLNSNEKMVLKKYFFMKTFGIKNDTDKECFKTFVKKFYQKDIYLRRYEKLFLYKSSYSDVVDNFNDGKDCARRKIIIDLINRLIGNKPDTRYDPDELIDIVIDNKQYNNAIDDIAKNSIYFKNEEKNRILFFKSKGKFKPLNDNNKMYYIKTIQSLLASYCINLKRCKRKQTAKKRTYDYSLSVDKQIKNIVDFKFGDADTVVGFDKIFN